jgi:hypothetical protein
MQIPVLAYILLRVPCDGPIFIKAIPRVSSATLPYDCQGGRENSTIGIIAEKPRFNSTNIRYGL